MAEEEGFEPPVPRGTTVFKTAAFDHSATPLCCDLYKNKITKVNESGEKANVLALEIR